MDKIKVLIIDRQTYFRAGMCQALSGQDDLELSDCDPTNDTIGLIETTSPDVVLLDIDPPSFSGFDLGRKITRHCPNTRLIMLTPGESNDDELLEVIKVGAVAYLSKNTTAQDLTQVVVKVMNGEYPIRDSVVVSPRAAENVLRQFQSMVLMGKGMESIASPLTFRETQVLSYIAEGNSNKFIAQILQISEQTIKNHVSSILRKLNANDRAQAAVIAIRNHLLPEEVEPKS